MNSDGRDAWVVSGPLAEYEAEFRACLARSGYAPRSVRDLVRVMARASRWLKDRGLPASDLTPLVAAELQAGLPGAGPVLWFLREAGGVPAAGSVAGTAPAEALLEQFRAWLAGERGLSAATVLCYGKQARTFLGRPGRAAGCGTAAAGRGPGYLVHGRPTARAVTGSQRKPW
jgi:hypothetical protein